MHNFQVYEIGLSGPFCPIGPCNGFRQEANARGYACAKAQERGNRNIYIVMGANRLMAVYVGHGIDPSDPTVAAAAVADGEPTDTVLDMLFEAA